MPRVLHDLRYPVQAGRCASSVWSGEPARCRWCDQPARPGSPWCGHRCEDEYRRNHWWDQAREAAVTRDGGCCVRCGLGPGTRTVARLLLRALIPMGPVEAARLWQGQPWRCFAQACELEVNHIEPRVGRGYASGCHHHLEGLETLCHRCHVHTTSAQHGARRAVG